VSGVISKTRMNGVIYRITDEWCNIEHSDEWCNIEYSDEWILEILYKPYLRDFCHLNRWSKINK
jgi:hypothetical protein